MNEMQRFLVEDHIQGLEHEAERLRAERASRRRAPVMTAAPPLATSATFAVVPATVDDDLSPRVRLGRWLVGMGAAIAGTDRDGLASAPTTTSTAAVNGPCDDGPTTLSQAA